LLVISAEARAGVRSIYWSEAGPNFAAGQGTIHRFDLDGSVNNTTLVSGLSVPIGPALDIAGGKMYWANNGTGQIQRRNIDGTGPIETLASVNSPMTPALDLVHGKMYWTTEAFTGSLNTQILRANLDGSARELLIGGFSGLLEPNLIALDVSNNKMYWSNAGAETNDGNIERANLDGSGREPLLHGLHGPRGLALDLARGKMYWSEERGTNLIRRADLNGSNLETLVTTDQNNPGTVAIDSAAGQMYWANIVDGGNIWRANLDGTNVTTVLSGLSYPTFFSLDIPEPAAISLLACGAVALCRRSRTRLSLDSDS
jgi:low density lipoprotein receptor-related protein 5/6